MSKLEELNLSEVSAFGPPIMQSVSWPSFPMETLQMAESFNVYVDESCHLQNDGQKVMVLGAVWCPQEKTRDIAIRIREIKEQQHVSSKLEVKWIKVSQSKLPFYQALVDYFLDDDDLRFRAIVVPDKSYFVHVLGCQTHDDWYYKLCLQLLEQIVDPMYFCGLRTLSKGNINAESLLKNMGITLGC